MEILEFLEIFLKKPKTSISRYTHHGWSWVEWYKFTELTGLIKFDCQFDEEGSCKYYKIVRPESIKKEIKCCCRNCRKNVGFLLSLPANIEFIKYISSKFDEKTGFWRSGSGCILPRKYRSLTCLTYKCPMIERDYINRLSNTHRILIEDVLNILSTNNRNITNSRPLKYKSSKIVNEKICSYEYKKIPSVEILQNDLKKVNYGL